MNTIQAPADTLHAAIMNLPCKVPADYPYGSELCAGVYKEGHRDARHAAAELISAASAKQGVLPAGLNDGDLSELFNIAMHGDRGNAAGLRKSLRAAVTRLAAIASQDAAPAPTDAGVEGGK